MTEIMTYTPTEPQERFHLSQVRNKLYGGALGGGKTRCLCEDINDLMIQYPGNRGLILRKVLADFKITTYLCLVEKTLKQFIEEGLVTENKSERYFQYWNGSRLYYGGLESSGENSASERKKYFSGEYGVIAIDEAREVAEQEFRELSSRLRHKLTDGTFPPFFMLLASNPSQNWLKTLFIRNPDVSQYAFFPALPKDNPYNPPDYESQLRVLFGGDSKMLQAYVEGSWDSVGDADDLLIMADLEPLIEYEKPTARPSAFARRVTSFDLAGMGDDKTVIYNFVENRVDSSEAYGKKEGMENVGRILYWQAVNKSRLVGGDSIFDTAVFGRLREVVAEMATNQFDIREVDFRESSSTKERFFNLRAEIYWYAREQIKQGNIRLPDDEQLHGQLCSIKYKFVGGGKLGTRIQIESKDEIKLRLKFSPDKADAFVIGLWLLQFVVVDKQQAWLDQYKQDQRQGKSHMAA